MTFTLSSARCKLSIKINVGDCFTFNYCCWVRFIWNPRVSCHRDSGVNKMYTNGWWMVTLTSEFFSRKYISCFCPHHLRKWSLILNQFHTRLIEFVFMKKRDRKKYKFLWLLLLLRLFLRFVIILGPSQFQRSRQQQERLLLLPILLLDWNHSISDKPIFLLLLLHFLKSSVCLFYNVFLFCCTHPVPSSAVHFVGLAWQEHNRTLPRPNKFQWQ